VAADAEWTRVTASTVLRAAIRAIGERGGAAPGERTVLDALVPSADALAAHPDVTWPELLAAVTGAAREGAEATRAMRPRRGRAAWTGDRAAGLPDAGATAYVRFLEALTRTAPTRSPAL
jgi:dihydroxyacetone kinase